MDRGQNKLSISLDRETIEMLAIVGKMLDLNREEVIRLAVSAFYTRERHRRRISINSTLETIDRDRLEELLDFL